MAISLCWLSIQTLPRQGKKDIYPPVLVPPMRSNTSHGLTGASCFCLRLWFSLSIMLFRIYSVERPRTPPPSSDNRQGPNVSRGFESPPPLCAVFSSISDSQVLERNNKKSSAMGKIRLMSSTVADRLHPPQEVCSTVWYHEPIIRHEIARTDACKRLRFASLGRNDQDPDLKTPSCRLLIIRPDHCSSIPLARGSCRQRLARRVVQTVKAPKPSTTVRWSTDCSKISASCLILTGPPCSKIVMIFFDCQERFYEISFITCYKHNLSCKEKALKETKCETYAS